MPVQNPQQLVEEFKKSGEFDRLRQELVDEFRNGDGLAPMVARVEDIVRKKLHYDSKLLFGPEATAQRELLQELDRYPVVERAVTELPSLSDLAFSASLRDTLSRIVKENRSGDMAEPAESQDAPASESSNGRPALHPLQTQTTSMVGSTTPSKEDESNARSVHFDDRESDSDSAMQESPVSERGHIEIHDIQVENVPNGLTMSPDAAIESHHESTLSSE
ncbi:COMPASS-Shg1 domain-containing protein [Phanerochaete sordida]|uniref:COMPASS-Shg1 domain-containing protein n=1 Tax=Phanerochaete sordida TaxID=48140 RepID=A0A9P3FYK9_9APHY|nr:COMPASS-Shg1 domain-containing protein [Phanerochaete sordida]